MKLLSRSHPQCRSVVFTAALGIIVCFFVLSYFIFYFDFLLRNFKEFTTIDYIQFFCWIFLGLMAGCPILLYFLGEVLWQVKGEEIILYDMNYLYIFNEGRILGRTKKIPWSNIKDIGFIKLSLYEQFIVHFSVSGKIEERIQIIRHRGRNIYCGVNLDNTECDIIINTIRELIEKRQHAEVHPLKKEPT